MTIFRAKQPRFDSQQEQYILSFNATSKPAVGSIVSSPMAAEDSSFVNKSAKVITQFLLE